MQPCAIPLITSWRSCTPGLLVAGILDRGVRCSAQGCSGVAAGSAAKGNVPVADEARIGSPRVAVYLRLAPAEPPARTEVFVDMSDAPDHRPARTREGFATSPGRP